jgi:hypothetical protein
MPLTANNAALLKNIASEKDADDVINKHMIDVDIGLKVQLYDAKMRLMDQHGRLAGSEGLLAATIAVSYYAQLGATAEIGKLADQVVASLRGGSQRSAIDAAEDPLSRLSAIEEFENQIQEDGPIDSYRLSIWPKSKSPNR